MAGERDENIHALSAECEYEVLSAGCRRWCVVVRVRWRRVGYTGVVEPIVSSAAADWIPCGVQRLVDVAMATTSFDEHINNVCKTAHFHMRALPHIRKCIDEETAKTIASSVIGARLDYCNSALYGTSQANLQKLQRVQNGLARIVKHKHCYDHIITVLAKLHCMAADISAYTVQSGAADIPGNFNKPGVISSRTGIISPSWKGAAL